MTKTFSRSACVYAVILLISWAHSLTAKGDVGPPYPSNGASVFVPFVNTNELSDPLLNMSALRSESGSTVPMLPTPTRRSMSQWTPAQWGLL